MKRLLIIGASILQLPAIQKAKEMGLYVGVVDYNPNAVGIPYADEYFNVSTIDEEGVYQTAKKFKADGIMTLATDMPMRSVAYAVQKLGLTGISYETAKTTTDKGLMIEAFEKHDVAHPWYYVISNLEELQEIRNNIQYPCISKPVDNAGSRGVVLSNNSEELQKAFCYSAANSRNGEVIIEEFLQGQEISVEVIVLDNEIHILQVTDKLTTGAPHFVEMGHSQPSSLAEEDLIKIRDLAKKAVKAVGINCGPAHVEIMLTQNGPKLIELGARMGGDCITTHLVPLSTGIDMVKATIRIALGENADLAPLFHKGSAIRYFSSKQGIFKELIGVENAKKIPGVKEITFTRKIGECIGEIDSSVDRAGYVIAQAETAYEAQKICENAMKQVRIIVG